MKITAYELTRLASMELKRADRARLESRAGTEKKALPVAELLYLLCISVFAYGAFLAMCHNSLGLSRIVEISQR